MAELLGTWDQLFRAVVRYTALPYENVDDIIAGGWGLGLHRARLLDRTFEVWQDVPFALSIFTWWPIKPSLHEKSLNYLLEGRWKLFARASSDENVQKRIIEVVPGDFLKIKLHELFEKLHTVPIMDIIKLPE